MSDINRGSSSGDIVSGLPLITLCTYGERGGGGQASSTFLLRITRKKKRGGGGVQIAHKMHALLIEGSLC